MPAFSGTVAALLSGKKVNAALLFTITFNDGQVVRLWTGFGNITLGGQLYKGAGRLVSADGIEAALGTSVPNATFKMAAVDTDNVPSANAQQVSQIFSLALAEQSNITGALIQLSVQVFGDGNLAGEWQPVDNPVGIGAWIGDQLSFVRQGPTTWSITLSAVSFFASRSRPQGRFYTDRDQQLQYPGDKAAAFVATLVSKNITWPLSTFA
jgi:hypothetical protein